MKERIAADTTIDGERIEPREKAKTVRVRNGQLLVTDGPFTEAKEWIAGYDLLNCAAMDEAIAIAAEHTMARGGRIEARVVEGDIVPLEEQDRTLWDAEAIEEGLALVRRLAPGRPGNPYSVQVAIAAVHARDYSQLAALYDLLGSGSVVAFNRAVAVGIAEGPEAGLAALDRLPASDGWLLPAARADFLRRLDRADDAVVAYEIALERVATEAERRYPAKRLAEVRATRP